MSSSLSLFTSYDPEINRKLPLKLVDDGISLNISVMIPGGGPGDGIPVLYFTGRGIELVDGVYDRLIEEGFFNLPSDLFDEEGAVKVCSESFSEQKESEDSDEEDDEESVLENGEDADEKE